MWKVLLNESFRAWAAVLLALPVNFIVMLNFASPGEPFALLSLSALVFPGTDDPPFSDYLYLAVGVTAAFAPPDVSVRSSVIRRRMTLQMLIGFIFATVTLAAVVGLGLSKLA